MGESKMLVPTLIIASVMCGFLWFGYQQGGGAHIAGVEYGLKSTAALLPLLLCALVAVGVGTEMMPEGVVERWLGSGSGWKGYAIATLAGAAGPPGGPIVVYSLVAGMLKSGGGIGPMICFMTAYNLLALHRVPMELGVLGWKFYVLRVACVLLFAPLAGLFAQFLATLMKVQISP